LKMESEQKKDAYKEGKIDGYEFNYKEYNK
jgi:hypothetical protein